MIKKITLGITLFFSTLMIASPAYADWKWVSESANGTIYYVDFDRIRTNGGYVYFWQLVDFLKPEVLDDERIVEILSDRNTPKEDDLPF